MSLLSYQTTAIIAAIAFIVAGSVIVRSRHTGMAKRAWLIPATLCGLFLAWSVYTVAVGGPVGFWAEHIRNAWGNQIFFDLLLCGGTAFALMAPRAKVVGMHMTPWFVLICCTGSIGLLAMVSRYMVLSRRAGPA